MKRKRSKLTITARIRFMAAMRVKVRLTVQRRSQTGFTVHHPKDSAGKFSTWARTAREAEQVLLAKVRTTDTLYFAIEPAREVPL